MAIAYLYSLDAPDLSGLVYSSGFGFWCQLLTITEAVIVDVIVKVTGTVR